MSDKNAREQAIEQEEKRKQQERDRLEREEDKRLE
ncbi:putative protein OS=Tsukamurella paurometabola (strain ATCC 8368 / DSM / CCUG 35730 /CIP 100753 / JCM 10117 / KCTC 9821 / NBRC 16120 / NCIMB 702349/ NCTC 13040) OX=521096 GN=Tpau_3204 PE=4 SV=1 [Tsukamurella paurometabola]|uniref:Uncharacterized protein n=1 Tax=Tsukamurella paurometabola (strain ATCC 8368 / DSM 20162 / CCUG 35730 / CIP 100753 / JCM 10117 / KCTC 9821 / NBRC 16120 / NCIMB 702349 / NCTC 13040) TaxID=521096 RepID=D5UVK9_TSUPD|nr:hypothetical protein Tpau_3204 [Tsukamurella paurometabola DSM 20162]SUP37245.1 Uncharacterised protein [Tsukamurella paurometabola]